MPRVWKRSSWSRIARAPRGARLLVLVGMLALPSSAALAVNNVDLTPAAETVDVGQIASFDLSISFDQGTIGGGIVILFDTAVASFDSFTFDGAFPDEPALRLVCPGPAPPCASFPGPGVLVAFANSGGISGPQLVGQLDLQGDAAGVTVLTMAEDTGVAGPFQPLPFGSFDPPIFGSATLTVAAKVPVAEHGRWVLVALLAATACNALRRRPSLVAR